MFRQPWQLVPQPRSRQSILVWLPQRREQPGQRVLVFLRLQVLQARLEPPMQRLRQQLPFRLVLSQGFPPSSAFLEHRRSQSTWQTRYYNNRIRTGGCRTFENKQH